MTALIPDLWAAYAAAREVQADARHAAAWHLVRQGTRMPSGYVACDTNLKLASEAAEVARAAGYEARALAEAAREEARR